MAKITKYFANQEEYDAYWQGAQPGSKYLCIIQDSGVEGLENVLVTTSNNAPNSDGKIQEMGASTIEIISEQVDIIAEQEDIISDYENDNTVSKTEYNAVVEELNDAEDISYDVLGEEKPFEEGWYVVVGDTGDAVPFYYVQQSDEWTLECGNGYFTNFPCYFMYVDEYGDETPYYTTDTLDWTELSDTPIYNDNKYDAERITCEESTRGYMSIKDGKDTWQLTTVLM